MKFLRQEFIDGHVEAVHIETPVYLNLTDHFNAMSKLKDFDPSIFGGALRDVFAETRYHDLDLCLANDNPEFPVNLRTPDHYDQDISEMRAECEEEIRNSEDRGLTQFLKDELASLKSFDEQLGILKNRGHSEEAAYEALLSGLQWRKRDRIIGWLQERGVDVTSDIHELTYKHISALSIKGRINDTKTDIVFADKNIRDAKTLAMLGDAPINCVAMGLDGKIWAHPDFETDLEDQKYRVRVKGQEAYNRAKARAGSLEERYPLLKFSVLKIG